MNKDELARLIKQTVDMTSGNGESDYTVLATMLLLMIAVFIVISRFMGMQIIKQQEKSATRQEDLLKKMNINLEGHSKSIREHTTEIAKHEVKIEHNEQQITGLWDKVNQEG